jgi:hypothetical protein
MKIRIIERTHPNGDISFIIQIQNRFLIFKWWENAHDKSGYVGNYKTLEDAKSDLYLHNGSKNKDNVVYQSN